MPLIFYIDSMRAIPVLVVLVWVYFAFPILTGLTLPPFWAALIGAHAAHRRLRRRDRARRHHLGPARPDARRPRARHVARPGDPIEIILPQSIVRMLPAFGSIISITIKDTAIASVIAVPEYMKRSQTVAGQSFHPIEVFTVAMLVYFVILFPITRIVDMHLRAGRASGPVMNLDWCVVWQSRWALAEGTLLTVVLTSSPWRSRCPAASSSL